MKTLFEVLIGLTKDIVKGLKRCEAIGLTMGCKQV